MAGLMAEYIKRKNNYTKKKKNKIVKDGKTYKSVPSGESVKRTAKEAYMDMFEKNKDKPGWLLEMAAHDADLQKEWQQGEWQQEMGEIEEEEPEGIQLEPFSVPGRIPREEEEKPEFILKEGKWVKNNYAMKKKKKKNNFGALTGPLLAQYMKKRMR